MEEIHKTAFHYLYISLSFSEIEGSFQGQPTSGSSATLSSSSSSAMLSSSPASASPPLAAHAAVSPTSSPPNCKANPVAGVGLLRRAGAGILDGPATALVLADGTGLLRPNPLPVRPSLNDGPAAGSSPGPPTSLSWADCPSLSRALNRLFADCRALGGTH